LFYPLSFLSVQNSSTAACKFCPRKVRISEAARLIPSKSQGSPDHKIQGLFSGYLIRSRECGEFYFHFPLYAFVEWYLGTETTSGKYSLDTTITIELNQALRWSRALTFESFVAVVLSIHHYFVRIISKR